MAITRGTVLTQYGTPALTRILEGVLGLMQKGTPAHAMIMEGAQILCLNPETVPTMVVLKVPCMNKARASHPLQKNDFSCNEKKPEGPTN